MMIVRRDRVLLALALVFCGASAAIAQVPSSPTKPLTTLATPHEGGTVFTADENGRSVSAIDTKTGRVVTYPVPIGPHNIQASADGRTLFAVGATATAERGTSMAMGERGRLVVIGAMPVTVGPTAGIEVGRHPAHVIVNARGTLAFVTNSADDALSVVDLERNAVVKTIGVGRSPHGLRMSPDGRTIYVANTTDGTVSVVSTEGLAETARIAVGKGPVQVAFAPDGAQVYVTLRDEDAVAVIDAATRMVAARIKVGPGPIQLFALPNGREVYVANQGTEAAPANTVSVIDVASRAVVADVVTGAGAHGVVVGRDGTRAFVTNTFADTVSEIDTATRRVTRGFPVGAGPGGITFVPAR